MRSGTINNSFKYLSEKKPTNSLAFRILHMTSIAAVSITVITLMALGIMSGTAAYEGNINLEISMNALQSIEPILTITAMLMMFKGKRNFYWIYMGAQFIITTTAVFQSMWMGVIRSVIIMATTTFTYIKWGNDIGGEIVIKKANTRVWMWIAIGLITLAVVPGITLQFIPADSFIKPQTLLMGWLDSVTFAGTLVSLVLTTYKYREARLISFFVAFFWPVMFFSTGVWLFATNSIFFWFVSLVGLAQWWHRSQFSPEEQKKMT